MSERMGSVDTAWWRMGEAGNPVDIGALLSFDGALAPGELRALASRLTRWERFRDRVRDSRVPGRRPAWELDPSFDLDFHVRHVALPAPADHASLERLVGDLLSDAFDPLHPPWRLTQIDTPQGSLVLARLHHALGDGFALAHALLSIADEPPAAPLRAPSERSRPRVRDLGLAAAQLLALPQDPRSALRGRMSGIRRVGWSEPLALDDLKRRAHADGHTVNDVLMAAVSGGFRRWLLRRGERPTGPLRALVPVNLRAARTVEEMPDTLGNAFGLVFLPLPVHLEDAERRMAAIRTEMERLKAGWQAGAALGLLRVVGHLPAMLERPIDTWFAGKASLVVSNVPGPKERLRFLGHELRSFTFWVPHAARLGVGTSLVSYAGEVRVAVRSDAAVLDDPAALVRELEVELRGP